MKSASRPGSWMSGRGGESSDRVGESSTTRWKNPRGALVGGPAPRRPARRHLLADELDPRLEEGAVLGDLHDAEALDPWTTRRSEPSGKRNILWMWVSVPTP